MALSLLSFMDNNSESLLGSGWTGGVWGGGVDDVLESPEFQWAMQAIDAVRGTATVTNGEADPSHAHLPGSERRAGGCLFSI